MNDLLVDPTAVLVVGGSSVERDRVASVVTDGVARSASTASSLESATSTLDVRDDVGCVVVLGTGPVEANGGTGVGTASDDDECDPDATGPTARVGRWCEAIHERDEALPVLVRSDDEGVAAALAARPACRYLPTSASDARLREAVADALETYDDRRRANAESSIFRSLLAESNIPVFAKDSAGRHLYKSDLEDDPQAPEDVVGKTDLELAEEGHLDAARDTYGDDMAVIETGEGIYEQEEQAGSGDDEYWSLTTKVPWRHDGEIRGLVGVSFGITWWKERERQLRAEHRRIERFTKFLAHDLRTPLQVAYGALDGAREGDPDAFEKVESAHERMRTIVSDMRGLSTTAGPSAGYDAVSAGIASTHLAPLVEEVWDGVSDEGATLSVEVPGDTVVVARTDVVRAVVETLLRNAVDHAGPDVTVRIGSTDVRGFYVADDGPGFPDAVLTALSADDPFDGADALGAGLLSIVETVEQQGWRLAAGESWAGGARVEIRDCPVVTDRLATAEAGEPVSLTDDVDVGPVSLPGSAEYDPETGVWHVVGDGRNVWGDINEFHFVCGAAEPPVRIQGRITGLDGVDEYSKAGFAVRAGTDPDAPFGYVGTTESHGSETTWRLARDGHTSSHQFEERPDAFNWYRVEYGDGTVTCYLSDDGEDWRPVDQRAVDLGRDVAVGLLVCGHSEDETCEARFEHVTACRLDT